MVNRCAGCGLESKTVIKKCVTCKKPLCLECSKGLSKCKDCVIIHNDKILVDEYFRDKYAQKIAFTQ